MDMLQICYKKLKKIFQLPHLSPIGEDLSCTILIKDPHRLVLTFIFDQMIEVKATIIHNCPTNVLVLQAIMNQVVADLFANQKQTGRLVFNEKEKKLENILKFNCLDEFQEQIELLMPLFVNKCYQWMDKLNPFIHSDLKLNPFKEQEIINFSLPF